MNASESILNFKEQRLLQLLQDELPLESRPYAALGRKVGLSEQEVLAALQRWRKAGILKRLAAILRHRNAGFTANGMSVWIVPQERLGEVAALMLGHPEVGHCYQRPAGPGWPYTLYAMLHGRSRDEVRAAAECISLQTGITEYDILFTLREYKKTSMRFFTDEIPQAFQKTGDFA